MNWNDLMHIYSIKYRFLHDIIGICVVVLFNLIEVNIAERIREIATLKVYGFKTAFEE